MQGQVPEREQQAQAQQARGQEPQGQEPLPGQLELQELVPGR